MSYPTDNQSNTMYNMANSFVSKIGDNKYKLKNLAYYERNDVEPGDNRYSCSKIKPVDDITFEVIDSTHININGINHELINSDWVYSSKIYYDVYQSIPKFEMDGDWWVDDKPHTSVSDGLNKNIKTPVLVVYNYNNEVGDSDERFFWGDDQWLGVEFGFKYPKLFTTRNATGKVFYIAIGIPRNNADTEKLFYTLMRSRSSTIAEDGYQVFINTLCDYFLMVDAIKYCKSTSSQNYYYPIASVSESVIRSSIIKEIDYFISGIKYKYEYSGDNDNINSMVSELEKIIYSYNENVNIKLSNNVNSIAVQIEESAIDFNSEIYSATENIREYSSVNSREMYIDQRHSTNDSGSPVNVMFNALKWDSGKFTINEISSDGGLHMRRDVSNTDDAGYVVSRIYNSTIYEV